MCRQKIISLIPIEAVLVQVMISPSSFSDKNEKGKNRIQVTILHQVHRIIVKKKRVNDKGKNK